MEAGSETRIISRPRGYSFSLDELKVAGLTERQIEVWRLYSELGNMSEVARRLNVSPQLVSKQLKRIKRKLERYEEIRRHVESTLMEKINRLEKVANDAWTMAFEALLRLTDLEKKRLF